MGRGEHQQQETEGEVPAEEEGRLEGKGRHCDGQEDSKRQVMKEKEGRTGGLMGRKENGTDTRRVNGKG